MLTRIPVSRLLSILAVGLFCGACRETAAPLASAIGRPQLSNTAGAGLHGAISLHSNRTGNFEIFVMNADGSDVTRVTNTTAQNFDPIWSPDGTQIAFGGLRAGVFEVLVINADGTGETQLTHGGGFPGAWSPDGKRIAFSGPNARGVFVMNVD